MILPPDSDTTERPLHGVRIQRDLRVRKEPHESLSLERIFSDLPGVPFRDHVWPKFLRENAVRVFGLDGG